MGKDKISEYKDVSYPITDMYDSKCVISTFENETKIVSIEEVVKYWLKNNAPLSVKEDSYTETVKLLQGLRKSLKHVDRAINYKCANPSK